MAVFINDLFDFFWFDAVPGNVLNILVVPLRLQLPELHRLKLAQGNAGFEALSDSAYVASHAHEPQLRLSADSLRAPRQLNVQVTTFCCRFSG
jgi:hypothetical protein